MTGREASRHSAASARRSRGGIGLALASGGPLGGIYEIGALLALADSIEHLDFNALDVHVGVSSGSFVDAALANGISPAQMYRLFINDGREAALEPELFLKPALREFGRRLAGLPALTLRAALQYLRDPLHRGVVASFATLSRAVPTGLFDNRAIGGQHYVDGALNKTLHASVALDEGVDLLVCVNPLVPFDGRSAKPRGRVTVHKLARGGLPLVLSQTFRAIIHSRMKIGMDKYAAQYPHADILLFEPTREDADMFFAPIFSYAQRKRLCALAFESTRGYLGRNATTLAPVLQRHGLRLRAERIDDADRAISHALNDPRPLHPGGKRRRGVRAAKRDLEHVLMHLERELSLLRTAR